MRKICIINQKGGVGKTTSVVNLAAGLSRSNRKVLIIDIDPQGCLAFCLHDESTKDLYDYLIENADIRECVRPLGINLDIISSKETLTKAETILSKEGNVTHLRRKLQNLQGYDYVLIDCAPSLGILNQNALLFCHEAFIPVSTDILGHRALKRMKEAVEVLSKVFDHQIKVTKIIPTLYDRRVKVCKTVLKDIKNEYYEIVADPISYNSKLKEAPKTGQSIFSYDPKSQGAQDYLRLVKSVIYDEARVIKECYPEKSPPVKTVKGGAKALMVEA
ncbi:ParA family protein [Candidatus Woesearchaeota archaeon]|nr:ParA family protein [Candidatus Woesearchaeota archaeon]HIH38364.1 ParA family protein [Candidatus Woesearchaeota archaeon]HIH49465.1 ParA family protein [Candidatus Woesearchaeota archaeon]HIJ04245.1 ParA family protein [Candidatus Woesearchaeota archaeon]